MLGKISSPNDFPHQHTAPVATRMPHLPVTATTKTAETRCPDSPSSPVGSRSPPPGQASAAGQSAASTNQSQPIEEPPVQPGECPRLPPSIKLLGSCIHCVVNAGERILLVFQVICKVLVFNHNVQLQTTKVISQFDFPSQPPPLMVKHRFYCKALS